MFSNNADLPVLPIWQARSFWAQLLLALAVVLNTLGIDLWQAAAEAGLGSGPEEVIATGERAVAAWQQLAPLVLGLWAWLERRAPKYRLGLGKDAAGALGCLVALALWVTLMPAAALAQAQPCGSYDTVLDALSDDWGEHEVWTGLTEGGPRVALTVHPDGSTWTLMVVHPDGRVCGLAHGPAWIRIAPQAGGEAG